MKSTLTSALLCCACALPSFSRDWLFVTTNWKDHGNERVLVMDPESGHTRTLWSRGTELDAIVSPDATRLYVTYIADTGYELAVVDTTTGGVLHKCETPQLIRWIFPTTPGMAISPDGRWLYLLKANYFAGSSEYSLLIFDTRDSRFVGGEQAVSQCPAPHPVQLSTGGNVVVLCRGGESRANDDSNLLVRIQHSVNFAVGRGVSTQVIYVAGWKGPIQAVDIATRQIIQTSRDLPVRNRRIMPSSNTMSPDGRLWYLPLKIPDNGEDDIEQILVFDTQTMSMANIITPVGPFLGLALSSDGRHLYASQQDLKSIMVIDTETRRCRVLGVPGKPSIILAVKAP